MRHMELPPRLAYDLENSAARIGASPEDLATVLLNLALALRGEAGSTALTEAVRGLLGERSVSPELLGPAFDELVARCLAAAHGNEGKAGEGGALGAWREGYTSRPYDTGTGGANMVKEQPIHAYGPPAPAAAPIVRASALGRYAHLRSGSEEFARAKEAEITLEGRVRR